MLWHSIAFVAIGKSLIFDVLGLHREWWRYFRLPELWPLLRGVGDRQRAPGRRRSCSCARYSYGLPRSVIVFDFILHFMFTGGARLATRMLAERPSRSARARDARGVLVIGAGSGGQMVVREMQLNPNLGAGRSASSTTTRASAE